MPESYVHIIVTYFSSGRKVSAIIKVKCPHLSFSFYFNNGYSLITVKHNYLAELLCELVGTWLAVSAGLDDVLHSYVTCVNKQN